MKFLLLSLSLIATSTHAAPFAIYGEDNRSDVFESDNHLMVGIAKSTAAMIAKENITINGVEAILKGRSLGDFFKLCTDVPFRQQPMVANCSGTLVAPDTILTASHCVGYGKADCNNYRWVFDYKVSRSTQGSVTVDKSNVYSCKEITYSKMDLFKGHDHALIKLDRAVTDRSPVTMTKSAELEAVGTPIAMIGHPSGLPTKITDGATILKYEDGSYVTNLDAFQINSGSGVFHGKTGELIGVLSSGLRDYDGASPCSRPVQYTDEQGREKVVPIQLMQTSKN